MWRIVFQIVPVAAWIVAFIVVVRPLALSRRGTFAASVLLALAFGKFAFFATVGGDAFTPNLPALVIWSYGWIYATAMLLTAAAFPFVVVCYLLGLAKIRFSVRTTRGVFAAFAICAAALSAWGIYEGVRTPDVNRIEIEYDDLPQSFDGYRIVHLSDIHCSTSARRPRFERIVERVNALDADLVAITGDFVDGLVCERMDDMEPLANLRARDGVWGCTGNHERYWEWDAWSDALTRRGLRIFSGYNRFAGNVIKRGDEALAIGGLGDPVFFSGDLESDERAIAEWTARVKHAFDDTPKGAFRILLFHRPYTERIGAEAADVKLQLSGHTHGGAMPVLKWLVAEINEGHVRGLYEFAKGRYLHVSPGTGQWAGFPLRLFNPTEITEITLRRKQL
ncbi:MAG: metallophosphoesterase [Kiritimatiellae bacterium]|nr:metallophosphoesterase [Kiritimatiellia bacterium]